jgi:hypothetical protein
MGNTLVRLAPAQIDFDTVSQGTEDVQAMTVENISEETLSMEVVEGPGKSVDLQPETKSLRPGESTQITLQLRKDAPLGNLNASLTVHFECSKIARVSIPISGVIVSQ